MSSRSFSKQRSLKPHLMQQTGGIAAEVNDLRGDVEKGFQALEADLLGVAGVVVTNVSNLSSFTVSGHSGKTFVEGDRVFLASQSTPSQCRVYTVGPVSGGSAPLTPIPGMADGDPIMPGTVFEVAPGQDVDAQGVVLGGGTWKAFGSGVYGTNDPLFWPRTMRGAVQLANGVGTVGSDRALFYRHLQFSTIHLSLGTLSGGNARMLAVPLADRTAGKAGTGQFTVRAYDSSGPDTSVDHFVNWMLTNW